MLVVTIVHGTIRRPSRTVTMVAMVTMVTMVRDGREGNVKVQGAQEGGIEDPGAGDSPMQRVPIQRVTRDK